MPLTAAAMCYWIVSYMYLYRSGAAIPNETQTIPMSIRGAIVYITLAQQITQNVIFGLILVAFIGWFALAIYIQSKYNVRLFGKRSRIDNKQ